MTFDIKPHLPGRRLLLPMLVACAFAAAPPARAEPVVVAALTRTAAPLQSPLPPGSEGSEELVVMLCQRGADPGKAPTAPPQELPQLCLVMQVDARKLQLGPARSQQLLDKAAASGQLTVRLLQPQ